MAMANKRAIQSIHPEGCGNIVVIQYQCHGYQYTCQFGWRGGGKLKTVLTPGGGARYVRMPGGDARDVLTPGGGARDVLTPGGGARDVLMPGGGAA